MKGEAGEVGRGQATQGFGAMRAVFGSQRTAQRGGEAPEKQPVRFLCFKDEPLQERVLLCLLFLVTLPLPVLPSGPCLHLNPFPVPWNPQRWCPPQRL